MLLLLENNLEGKFLLIEVKNAVEIGVTSGRSQGIYLSPLQKFNIIILRNIWIDSEELFNRQVSTYYQL